MNSLLPGQAAATRQDGKVCLVVCDHQENLPIGGVAFEIRGGIHRITFGDSTVAVASVILRLTTGEDQRFYFGWINELEEGVVELLATQPELPILFETPWGEEVGGTEITNGLRPMMQKQLATIPLLADKNPWQPRQFVAAKAVVEAQFPTAEALWAKLGGDITGNRLEGTK